MVELRVCQLNLYTKIRNNLRKTLSCKIYLIPAASGGVNKVSQLVILSCSKFINWLIAKVNKSKRFTYNLQKTLEIYLLHNPSTYSHGQPRQAYSR